MKRKLPLILTIIYLVAVVVSAIPIFTGNDALAGIFAVLLTQPWASLLGKFLSLNGGIGSGLLLVGIGAVINASIIFLVSKWVVGLLARG